MRKIIFAAGEYYHAYNRGVEKRRIFLNRRDCERFLYLLFACNSTEPILNSQFHYRGLASIERLVRHGDQLVDIVCFCLMPNHFHLLLKQRRDNGVSAFMQKLGTGYTMYFNAKYARDGVLFQGTFKAVHVVKEKYLTHLTRYLHLNPAELCERKWKELGIRYPGKTHEFVKAYPWSSYADYLGRKRFTNILNFELISSMYPKTSEYEDFVKAWLAKDFPFIAGYTIEA